MNKWPKVSLGEIFEIARGGSPRPIEKYITDDPFGINWIMIGDATENSKYICKTKKKIIESGVAKSRMVYQDDFLLSNSMSFGRPYILKTEGCIHDGWLVLRKKNGSVDNDFFYHLLGSKAIYTEFKKRASGAVVKNLNIDIVKSIQIFLPPIGEQKRIAAILDKANVLRENRRQAIAKLDELLQSVFLDMFGDPVKNPKVWNEICGDNLFKDLRYGTSEKCSNSKEAGALPVIRIPNVIDGKINFHDLKFLKVEEKEANKLLLKENDILFVRTNGNPEYIGRCAVYTSKKKAYFASYLIRSRLDNESPLLPQFLKDLISFPTYRHKIVCEAKTTAGNYNISTIGLKNLVFIKPPMELQNRYLQQASAIHKAILNHDESLKNLDNLFFSLQHRAFKGEL